MDVIENGLEVKVWFIFCLDYGMCDEVFLVILDGKWKWFFGVVGLRLL